MRKLFAILFLLCTALCCTVSAFALPDTFYEDCYTIASDTPNPPLVVAPEGNSEDKYPIGTVIIVDDGTSNTADDKPQSLFPLTDVDTDGDGVADKQLPFMLMQTMETPAELPSETVNVQSIIPTENVDDSSMSALVRSIFGTYTRQQYQHDEYDGNGELVGTSYEYVNGLAGLDYEYLTGVLCFAVVLSSFFKLIGVVFKRG